jgi:uncharacterized coiled-coil protein SlyX
MARVEEKIIDLETRRAEGHERLNRISVKVDEIDNHVVSMRERMNVITKVMWVVVAGIIGAFIASVQTVI